MTASKWLIAIIAALGIGFSISKFLMPPKVETVVKETIVYRDKIVQDEDKKTKTHTIDIKKPDGTETITTDTGEDDAKHTTDTKDESTSISQTTTVTSRPSWLVSAAYAPTIPVWQNQRIIGILQKRLFSEVYAGVSVSSDHNIGVIISVGF